MERNIRVLPTGVLMEQILGLLEETEPVPLTISGSSMFPFLFHRRDTVYLSKIHSPLKKGDMVLYRRANGQYILHRIVRVGDGTYGLLGDRQVRIEPGIRREQMLAVVTAVRRDGKLLEPGSFAWDFFEKTWTAMGPFRPWLIRIYCLLTGKRPEDGASSTLE